MKPVIVLLLLILSSSALAANSLVRVDCMEGATGAKVSLNGQYQFTCSDYQKKPIYLEAGDYTLKAVKPVSKEYQQVFTQQLSLVAGTPQRVRVVLPAKTLTAYGKAEQKRKQEKAKIAADARQKQAKIAAKAEAKEQRELAVKKDMADAQTGNAEAMKRLAARYEKGDGVPEDAAKAKAWQQKAVIADLKRKQQSMSYFPLTDAAMEAFNDNSNNPSDVTVLSLASPAFLLSDSVSTPSVTSNRNKIQARIDELETHASRWAKPNSMVARAYRARQPD